MDFKIKSLKDRYIETMANKISVSLEDLTENEKRLIEEGYILFSERMEDIKILEDEVKRVSIELSNLKSYNEDLFNDRWGEPKDDEDDE